MGVQTSSVLVRRLLLASALWAGVVAALWLLARWILMSDRGLDLSDEAIYLVEASAPESDAAFMFPAGWHTRFIFTAVGGDVAAFRTAGAVLLGLAGIWVGLSSARLIGAARARQDLFLAVAAGITGLSAAWLYYFTLLRAPGYNWVNLTGMAIVVGAALRQWARFVTPAETYKRWIDIALIATIGFGIVFSLAAKPTTPIFIALSYFATTIAVAGFNRAIRALAWIVIASVLWIPVLIIVGWWDLNFIQVFWDAVQRPSMTQDQTPVQGLVNLLSLPWFAYQDFRGVNALPITVVAVAIAALLSNTLRPWRHPTLLIVPLALVLGVTPYFAASSFQIWQQGWELGNLTIAILLVVIAVLLVGLGKWDGPQPVGRFQLLVAVGGLVLLSAAFGFGSSNTPYPMMKFAAVLLAAGALIPLTRVTSQHLRRGIAVLLALSMTVTTAHLLIRSQVATYGSINLRLQTESVTVGAAESTLLVDEERARVMDQIRQAIQAGGGAEVRLIPIGPDTLGLAFSSGATTPKSVVLGWFGQPGAVDLARANLARLNLDEWCDGWMLTHSVSDETDRIAALFAQFTDRQWPIDYQREVQANGFNLWAPRNGCQ